MSAPFRMAEEPTVDFPQHDLPASANEVTWNLHAIIRMVDGIRRNDGSQTAASVRLTLNTFANALDDFYAEATDAVAGFRGNEAGSLERLRRQASAAAMLPVVLAAAGRQ